MGGVEGRDRDTKWNNKFEVKIQEGNKHKFPLRFNLNSKNVVAGKE